MDNADGLVCRGDDDLALPAEAAETGPGLLGVRRAPRHGFRELSSDAPVTRSEHLVFTRV